MRAIQECVCECLWGVKTKRDGACRYMFLHVHVFVFLHVSVGYLVLSTSYLCGPPTAG